MATLRQLLTQAEFDFESGSIYYSESKEDDYSPGWGDGMPAVKIDLSHPILDKDFYTGYGSPQCPRFIAYDKESVYFPCQYDGSSWVESVYLKPDQYLGGKTTPYPGG